MRVSTHANSNEILDRWKFCLGMLGWVCVSSAFKLVLSIWML
ncbi:hypothetical protein ES332_A05G207000v1 [Gossypium tomentosum]|uniref:Uncharacterized protein n=1 Tax=Gossypium tomentosum TaxID=34277 RepID=A0A5D2QIA4_GOSTO|nr:hypothetical protein ES332_A05G207000v1 [Gossypium tomentosum]